MPAEPHNWEFEIGERVILPIGDGTIIFRYLNHNQDERYLVHFDDTAKDEAVSYSRHILYWDTHRVNNLEDESKEIQSNRDHQ